MKNYCFGVDIGGTSVKLGLFTIQGELLEKWEIKTRKDNSGAYIIGDIATSIQNKMKERKLTIDDVLGAGMGVPGPVMENGTVSVCVNLGWVNKKPAEELSALLGVPVKCSNDANSAAYGEMWIGGGKGYSDVVAITLGTGVGGGVILDGKIVAGNRGLGGELGHIVVNPNEKDICNCGNKGCLEQYASATGVVRVAKQKLRASNMPSVLRGKESHLSAKMVFDAAKIGDELALEAVDQLGYYLGLAMSFVTLTIDPDVFVIGGGVSKAGGILLQVIVKYYEKFTILSPTRAKIALAQLGNDAGIYGAARMALE